MQEGIKAIPKETKANCFKAVRREKLVMGKIEDSIYLIFTMSPTYLCFEKGRPGLP
jgi:hypothetical protein